MTGSKKFKELTIKNNFMFGAVMCDENNCKEMLEMVLQVPIERIEISKEKSIVYHPAHKGVRLDVYAKDRNNTHYDVEMQAIKKKALGKRARYYHSQIDMELLYSGESYESLPNTYVIFVCDFDPFGKKKYCYTFANQCLEDATLNQGDGCRSIFLSTHGENEEERAEARAEGRAEGRTEGEIDGKREAILVFLEELGALSEELRGRIQNETDLEVLTKWVRLAAKAESMEQFEKNM